jgi:hypothetical protein
VYTFEMVAGERFSLDRPGMTDDMERELKEVLREIVEEEGKRDRST